MTEYFMALISAEGRLAPLSIHHRADAEEGGGLAEALHFHLPQRYVGAARGKLKPSGLDVNELRYFFFF